MILSKTGEVVDIAEADQFQALKSQFECGFFAVAIAKSAVKVGDKPSYTPQQIISYAEQWYQQYNGDNSYHNMSGMSLEQLYELLKQVQLHFQETATDINTVKKWVQLGYLAIVAIQENSVSDIELGSKSPYPWTPSGNHIIVITGVTSSGQFIVRDSANCTNLYDPNSLRPGPRIYNASRLRLVSATVVVPPGLPRPVSAKPPNALPVPVKPPVVVTSPVQSPSQSEQIKTLQDKLTALGKVNDTLNEELSNAEKEIAELKSKLPPVLTPDAMSLLQSCANLYLALKGN